MPLQYQLAAVKFTDGLDTRTQDKLVVPGKWAVLDNLTLSMDQTPHRRDGVSTLVARTGNGLATYGNQLLAINGGSVYSISGASGAGAATLETGKHSFVGVSKREVYGSAGMQDFCDVATGSPTASTTDLMTCYVWRSKDANATVTGFSVSVVDQTTGAVLLPATVLKATATALRIRVVFAPNVAPGGTFYIFYSVGNFLYCRTILTGAPATVNAETTLINSANFSGSIWDCCVFGSDGGANSTAMVAYQWQDGTTSARSFQVSQAAGIPSAAASITLSTQLNLATASLAAICCVQISSALGAAFTFTAAGSPYSGTEGYTINTAWVIQNRANIDATAAPAGGCNMTAVSDGSTCNVFTDCRGAWNTNAVNPVRNITCNTTLGAASQSIGIYSSDFNTAATDAAGPKGPYIGGKAFISGGRIFLPLVTQETYQGLLSGSGRATNSVQNAWYLLDCGTTGADPTPRMHLVAHALYGLLGTAVVGNDTPYSGSPPSVISLGDGTFLTALTEREFLTIVNGFNTSPTGVVGLRLAPNTTQGVIKADLGQSLYLAGGNVTNFDGVEVMEHPFPLFPDGLSAAISAGAGMTAGTHQFVAIYEYVDNAGNRYQSAPSLPVAASPTGGNSQVTVKVPTLHLTQLLNAYGGSTSGGVQIVLYATQAAGLTFNRVGSTGAGSGGVANDTTAAFVTIVVSASDADLASNEVLYTQPLQGGTTLANYMPPPCTGVAAHQNRLFGDCADQPGTWFYSQPYVNNLGLGFNPVLGGSWPAEGGDFRGFASMDEKLILFCSRKIYVIAGTGPNLAGNFSNYSEAIEIPSDVGCQDARSILKMPKGIMFKSPKGFYLLGRDLSVNYIGEGVAEFDSYTITSAVMMENQQECRFGTNSTVHPQLVYCYLDGGQWSTNSFPFDYVTRDAVYWTGNGGRYMAISATLGVQQDTPGVHNDTLFGGGTAITWTAKTAYLHLSEIGGFQRVRWLLLTMNSEISATGGNGPASIFTFNVYVDDSSAFYQFTVDLSTISFADPLHVMDLRHKIETQKCKSIAFQFSDAPSDAMAVAKRQVDGLQALTLEVGLKRGTFKLPGTQGVS